MSSLSEENLAVAERYQELYNTDPERFVRECYHDDFRVDVMGIGPIAGIKKFVEVEKSVLAAAPGRRMRVDRMHATDCAVTVEAVLVDTNRAPGSEIPFCAVLEIRDGKISVDRTYADFSNWPGLNN